MAYPNMLAGGMTAEGSFLPTELFAGESDIVTDRGTAGADIAILQIVALQEDGTVVPWTGSAGNASKAGTFTGTGTAADTITINGVAFTLVASAATTHEVTIGADAAGTAANLVAKINAVQDEVNVSAVAAGAVVTLTALEPGVGGNTITLAEASSAFSWAGAATTLSGGSAETESRAVGIAAQAATIGEGTPYFTGGVFNHEVLGWPAGTTTLAQRKAVFARTNIQISKLLGSATAMVLP